MDLDRSLLKEFAKVVNDVGDKPEPKQYVHGTVTTGAGNTKCVMLDGSDTMTPISEVVNAEAGDRVLVSVSNHQATVIGNITFPPSARKENQAIESANGALNQSNQAMEKAKDAQTKASSAITDSSVASALANEAKTESAKAQESANTAIQNASEAKQLAQASSDKSDETQQLANQVKDSVAAANKDIGKLKTEVKTANDNIASANTKLDAQAGEISTIKETYSTKVETESTKAELTTEISKQVGALQTTVEKNFSTKTENVALEKKLQTQITQNADSISSTVTKVEKLQSDTTEQQKNIDKALQDAQAAQTAADSANTAASNAKTAADTAQKAADTATANAASAQKTADLANEKVTAADKNLQSAKTDLAEAQENLKNVTSRVDATEQEITDAKQKVDTANANVTQALKDVAEANAAASKANEVASKAQGEATAANKAANDAQTKAADAQKVANQASADASKAQKDLAALTNRVIKAETNITQTNEAITAQASRITEVKNNADSAKAYADTMQYCGYPYFKELYIKGDADKYYPVILFGGDQDRMRDIVVSRYYGHQAPAEWNGHPTAHGIALNLKIKCNFGGWGGATYKHFITDFSEQYGHVFAGCMWVADYIGYAIFLRGGGENGAYYRIFSDQQLTTKIFYNPQKEGCEPYYNGSKDLLGNSGETYKWYAPEPRVYSDTIAEQIANMYTDEVANKANDKINNLQVGGRNLLIGGKFHSYGDYNQITSQEGSKKIVTTWNSANRYHTITLANNGQNPKGTHTISGFINVNGNIPTSNYFVGLASTYGDNLQENYYDATTGYFKITQDYHGDEIWILHALTTRSSNTSDVVEFTNLKFEIGNKATDWTPAPEDLENDLHNNYYSKTETDAQIKVSADEITQSVTEVNKVATSANSKIDNLQIGGRNLLKNSKNLEFVIVENPSYVSFINGKIEKKKDIPLSARYGIYYDVYNLKANTVYTFSCICSDETTSLAFSIGIDANWSNLKQYIGIYAGKFIETFTTPSDFKYIRLYISFNNSEPNGTTCTISEAQLEIGNKATDWTPAPEDQEQYVDNKIAVSEKITEDSYKSLIDQTKNDIAALVQKVQKETTDNSTTISEMSTNFKVTADGLSATKSAVKTLTDAVNGTVSKEEMQKYIRWNGDYLELGNSAQPFKCKLSNTELAFYQNTDKVAWITNKELYILKAIIAQSIGCGNFLFVDEGDLGFSLI